MIYGGAFHLGELGLHRRVVEAAPDATGRQHCSLAAPERQSERPLRCSFGFFRHTLAGRCTKSSQQAFDGRLAWLGELGKESSAGIGPERVKGEAMDLSKTNTKECPLRPSVSLREDWDIGGIPPPEVHPQAGGGRRQESKGKGAAYVWHSSC